jgi:hypothetical protein
LIGFGLIKGRSDVTQLTSAYAAVVGLLLLIALITGTAAAVLIMRAAHGRPYATSLRKLSTSPAADLAEASRRAETDASARALNRGVILCFACTTFLTAAVALTWYGPAKEQPRIEAHLLSGARRCGEVVAVSEGRLTLKTAQGQITVDLTEVIGLTAVDSCAPTSR